MNILNGFGGKGLAVLGGELQAVVERLNVVGGQRIQANGSDARLEMVADSGFVGADSGGFDIG